MSRITFSGLASGIDTDVIIEQLSRFNEQRINTLREREVEATSKQAIFKNVELRILDLQAQTVNLSRSFNGTFDRRTATSSDESILQVAAGNGAQAGTHTLRVTSLAKAHQVASQGFASQSDEINTGTLSLKAGGATTDITIDSTNNTLEGLADAINASDAGVQASIINTGSGATPFQLLLSSEASGADNAITITNNLDTGGAAKPDFSAEVQAATDAQVQIGSGAGAITVSRSTNVITDLFAGVTLDLQSADAGKDVKITISNDTAGVRDGVQSFVDSFNGVMDLIDENTRFDAETNTIGPLASNRSVISIQERLRQSVMSVSAGLPSAVNRLSALGISINRTGRLELDSGKLDELLNGQVDGVTFDDVKRGFSFSGVSTHSGIEFAAGTLKTQESTVSVDITQVAEKASIAGTALADNITIDGTNNTLSFVLDGIETEELTISSGTYTRAELAVEVQSLINGDKNVGIRQVSVAVNASNQLEITSETFGSNSLVRMEGGTAVTTLGFTASQTDTGQDVAGSFIVNGVTETATGRGQILTGAADNEKTSGLRITATLGASELVSGVDAEVTLTRGAASRFRLTLDEMLNAATGRLKSINDAFQDQVEDAQETVSREQESMDRRQESLLRQFAALESVINRANAQRDVISGALASLTSSQNQQR